MEFIKKHAEKIAAAIIAISSIIAVISAYNESPIIDELPHVASGYSYVAYQDYRLNPEHPPLAKALAGSALAPLGPTFPKEIDAWNEKVNGQWDIGWTFFYMAGNNPETIIRLARAPMIVLFIILGAYLYRWTKEEYGKIAGLIALFLFSFSPNFIAHSRYVTTDVAAVLGVVIGLYYFSKCLKKPSAKTITIAGIALGVAMLLKFSVFILYPFIALMMVALIVLNKKSAFYFFTKKAQASHRIINSAGAFFAMGIISLAVVWVAYMLVSLGTPEEIGAKSINYIMARQISGTDITSQFIQLSQGILLYLNEHTLLRPLAHFFLGLFMVFFRVGGGNNAFLLGEVTRQSWWYFYPIAFLIKTPIPALLLLGTSVGIAMKKIVASIKNKKSTWNIIIRHQSLIILSTFSVMFFLIAVFGNLNLGIRHIAPIYPAIYMFIGAVLSSILKNKSKNANIIKKVGIVAVAWLLIEVVRIYPFYLSYFNNFIGSQDNAYKYLIDSNLDWGQDLQRLNTYLEENDIDDVHVVYFGGGNVDYYLKGKAKPFDPYVDKKIPAGWLAISATPFQTEFNGIEARLEFFEELREREPDAQIGHSILLYNIKE